MKTFIVGSSGFLGSHLARFFSGLGAVVAAPRFESTDDGSLSRWQGEVLAALRDCAPDLVLVPGASQSTGDDADAIDQLVEANCVLPAKIASALLRDKPETLLVTFGSSWQFADSNGYRPFNLYAATKQAGQDLLAHYSLRGLRVLQLILFDTYSEDDTRRKLFTILVDAARTGAPIDTTPGLQEIDLVHVDDVCRGVLAGVEDLRAWDPAEGPLVLGLGSGRPITVSELIDRIAAQMQLPIGAHRGGRPYRPREVMKVFRDYRRPSGWVPLIDTYHARSSTQ